MPAATEDAFTRFEKLIDKLNSPSSISKEVRIFYWQFASMLKPMYNVKHYRVFPNLYDTANTLTNISSFVVYIDKYKQLTSETNFPQLVKSVESFLPPVSIIEQLLRPVIEQLYGIHKLMSSSVKASEKQALIGFPRGAKDMEILSKIFDDGLVSSSLGCHFFCNHHFRLGVVDFVDQVSQDNGMNLDL
uniref:Uncharacterized protein n=1 Tax=Caenorhabditis japonica TaxID=281687 RepID=A0A8R1DZ84_CAEJA